MANFPEGLKITWLGHSTFTLETPSGKRLLIDPWVMNNPACPADLRDPGPLDVILVTHAHFDHIGDCIEIARSTDATIVSIAETSWWLASKGFEKLIEMNKGGAVDIAGCRAHMVHAVHSCGIKDGDQIIYGGEAAGFVIEFEGGFRLYHAGDTAVHSDMSLIGKLLRPDMALLPIGGHYVMDPTAAAEAIRLLGVRRVVPMHYGTFPVLTGTPRAVRDAAYDVPDLEVMELKPGDVIG